MIAFLKGIHASWRANTATIVTLLASTVTLSILLSIAIGDGGSSEGKGLASSFSVITGTSAIFAIRGIQAHSYSLRGPLIDLLRAIGVGWKRLHILALGEACLLVALTWPLSVLIAWPLAPVVGAYLRNVNLLLPHETAQVNTQGALAAFLILLVISCVCSVTSIHTFRRQERQDSTSFEGRRKSKRKLFAVAANVALLFGVVALWYSAGFTYEGIGQAFFGAILFLAALPWLLVHIMPRAYGALAARLSTRFAVLQTQLRKRGSSRSIGVTYGAIICVLGGTIFGGYYLVSDSTARSSWTTLLGDTYIDAVTGDESNNIRDGRGIYLHEIAGNVTSSDDAENFVWTTPNSARSLLETRLAGGQLDGASEGVAVTRFTADSLGVEVGDETLVEVDGSALQIVAIVEVPNTFGSYFVASDHEPDNTTQLNQATRIVPSDAGPQSPIRVSASTWIDQIPSGAAVSNSGGYGVAEAPLLMGAPILLGLTLMLSSRIVTLDNQRTDDQVLRVMGASRTTRCRLALTESVLDVYIPAAIGGLIAIGVVLWADRMMMSALGAFPDLVSVIALPGALWLTVSLVDGAAELLGGRNGAG